MSGEDLGWQARTDTALHDLRSRQRMTDARVEAVGRVAEKATIGVTELDDRMDAVETRLTQWTENLGWVQFVGTRIPGITLSLRVVWRLLVLLAIFSVALGWVDGPLGSVVSAIFQ